MMIALITGEIVFGRGNYETSVFCFSIEREDEERYYLKSEDEDEGPGGPRGDFLYKQFNKEGLENGYESLYTPLCTECKTYAVYGHVYVLEGEIEQGKELLKNKLIATVEKEILRFEKIRDEIKNS